MTPEIILKNISACRVAGITALCGLLALVHPAQAQTTSAWNGGTTNWATAGNWTNGLPSTTVSALFNSTFANQPTLTANQTAQGLWLATGVGQDVTINSATAQTLTLTGTATLNSQANAGIYMNDTGNHNLTIGPNTSITLSSNTGFYNQQSSGLLSISGGLDLNNKTLTIGAGASSTGNVTIGGNITSTTSGALTINSGGTVTLSGSNSYKGATTLTAGTLIAGSSTAFGTGALALSAGTLQASTDVVLSNSSVSLSSGTTIFSGANSITITGASTAFIAGGNKTITNTLSSGKALTFSGNLTLNGNTTSRQLTIAGTGDTTFSGNLSDNAAANGAFVVSSSGTTTFSGANTFSGSVSVNSGATLKAGNANALGFGGTARGGNSLGTTTVSSGGVLDLSGTTGINEPIILNGTGIGGAGALINNSGSPASISTGIAALTLGATGSGTAGYSSAPTITISGTGTGASATATLGLTTASITSITSGGSNWAVGDTLGVSGTGGGVGAVATVTSVSGGAITGLSITTAGVEFLSSTTALTLARLTGSTNAVAPTVTFNTNNFTVGGIKMTAAGSGYTGTPTATWDGGGSATTTLSSVTLASNSSIGGSGNITIDAVVSEFGGSRTLTKVGAGTLTLSGSNTYSGNTLISGGVLQIGNGGTSGSIAGSAVTNNATLAYNRSDDLTASHVISGSGNLAKFGAGTLTLTGDNTYSGGTTVNAGVLAIGGSGRLGSSGTYNANITNAGSLQFASSANQTLGGVISGAGSVGKTGAGTLTLSGANTFSGVLTVADGKLTVATINNASENGVLGNSANAVVLGSSGQTGFLHYTGGTTSSTKTFTAASGGTAGIEVSNAATTLTLSGAIGGAGNVQKGGSGTLALSGSNTFTGAFNVHDGTIQIATINNASANGVLGNSTNAVGLGKSGTSNTATLRYTGGSASSTKHFALNSDQGGAGVFQIDNSATALALSGVISGAGKLTKSGAGSLILSGVNSYSGATTVNAGTLIINGTNSGTGALTVASGATLGGSGTIGGDTTIQTGAFLAPGNSPGLITFERNLTLEGDVVMELNGVDRGVTYDAINVGGLLTYGGKLTLNFGSTFDAGSSLSLFNFNSYGGSFNSIELTGSYGSGSLANTSGTWMGTVGGQDFKFLQSTGVLEVVPEPSTYAMLILSGVAMAGYAIRRRHRRENR